MLARGAFWDPDKHYSHSFGVNWRKKHAVKRVGIPLNMYEEFEKVFRTKNALGLTEAEYAKVLAFIDYEKLTGISWGVERPVFAGDKKRKCYLFRLQLSEFYKEKLRMP